MKPFFSLIFILIFNSSAAFGWSYDKTNVIDFLSAWRTQVGFDPYLDEIERDMRLQLIDRFTFQTDRKYNGENLKDFLIFISWDMALTDEMQRNKIYGSDALVLKNLNQAIKEILEPSENILSFLRSFIEYSTLKNPRPLEDLINLRAYSNENEVQAASPMDYEDIVTQENQIPEETTTPEPPLDSQTPESQSNSTLDQSQNSLPPQTELAHPSEQNH
jgi:hypothetical protein